MRGDKVGACQPSGLSHLNSSSEQCPTLLTVAVLSTAASHWYIHNVACQSRWNSNVQGWVANQVLPIEAASSATDAVHLGSQGSMPSRHQVQHAPVQNAHSEECPEPNQNVADHQQG